MAKKNEKLRASFTWAKGDEVWFADPKLLAKREEDFLKTREHRVIEKLNPSKQRKGWGGDGAVS